MKSEKTTTGEGGGGWKGQRVREREIESAAETTRGNPGRRFELQNLQRVTAFPDEIIFTALSRALFD